MEKTSWISSPIAKFSEDCIYTFEREFINDNAEFAKAKISAESRYKLYVNGIFVVAGPCKGNRHKYYYDEVVLTNYLKKGKNTIDIKVLQLSSEYDTPKHIYLSSVYRSGKMAMMFEGTFSDGNNTEVFRIVSDKNWKVRKENGINFIKPTEAHYAGLPEYLIPYDNVADNWYSAVVLTEPVRYYEKDSLYGEDTPRILHSRTIPQMKLEECRFINNENNSVYDAGEYVTAYVKFKLRGYGKVKITYAEGFSFGNDENVVKKDRTDSSGVLRGDSDIVLLDGNVEFEPFWFRSFRYITFSLIDCSCFEIEDICYVKTNYPLVIGQGYDFGNARDNELWDISVRTLKCCMHETYEDCPYFEQLQYEMDTYLQMMFTYKLTDDDRLAKKAIDDFACSVRPDGMLCSRYPSFPRQYIPTFSLFFIFMIKAHLERFNDKVFVQQYLNTIYGVLSWFDKHINDDGLVVKTANWNFIDWVEGWERGQPVIQKDDVYTIQSLMYAKALGDASEIFSLIGKNEEAESFLNRKKFLVDAINSYCYDNTLGIYKDGPNTNGYSQHTQIWAILSDTANRNIQKEILKKSFDLSAKASLSFTFFLLRALEKTEMYNKSEEVFENLSKLIEQKCSTMPEIIDNPRSDCHGWSAFPIYEFTSMILGVKTAKNSVITIAPYIIGRKRAKGHVKTILGDVYVDWNIDNFLFTIKIITQKDTSMEIVLPDGSVHLKSGKSVILTCQIEEEN